MALPQLREELDLLPGPLLGDGQPSWTLHDPVRNQFLRLDWPTFEILSRWSLDDAQAIAESVAAETTLQIGAEEVKQVAQFLLEHQLLQPQGADSARQLAARLEKIQGSPLKWLLHHYLFFRIPLWRPDGWLERWQGAAGHARVKTGSLSGVAAVAGYVDGKSGRRHVVVGLIQHPDAAQARPVLDALLTWARQDQ